ncbi:hypothetical protein [Companilactobacillus jidongensis]|uniref:hypothetical protein n=1 Tax=Companilactobacillus jidongensis TaxID=2486006 RepID=UPI000F798259|nr:hypothetical protein [Companilactobacillus jidongensis]
MTKKQILNEIALKNISGGKCKPHQAVLYCIAGGMTGALGGSPLSIAWGIGTGLATCEIQKGATKVS